MQLTIVSLDSHGMGGIKGKKKYHGKWKILKKITRNLSLSPKYPDINIKPLKVVRFNLMYQSEIQANLHIHILQQISMVWNK